MPSEWAMNQARALKLGTATSAIAEALDAAREQGRNDAVHRRLNQNEFTQAMVAARKDELEKLLKYIVQERKKMSMYPHLSVAVIGIITVEGSIRNRIKELEAKS